MKRWSAILLLVMVGGWMLVDSVHEFFANETMRYFSDNPHHLLYVALVGLAGGFAALGFDRLAAQSQRHVKLFCCGGCASILTAVVGYLAVRWTVLGGFITESGFTVGVLLVFLVPSGLAAFFWFEFYRAWKKGVSQ